MGHSGVAGQRRHDKQELYRWLKLDRPTQESGAPYPPGYCHFPQYGEEYFKQLTAEQLVTRIVKGYRRPEWRKTRDRNEALDVRSYSRAAAAVYGMDRFTDTHWQTLEDHIRRQVDKTAPPPPAPPQRTMVRSPWMDR
jgi:phage terminase large subunit GpA-like protein